MTFRKICFLLAEAFLGLLSWQSLQIDTAPASDIGTTSIFMMVVLFMVPLERVSVEAATKLISAVKGGTPNA